MMMTPTTQRPLHGDNVTVRAACLPNVESDEGVHRIEIPRSNGFGFTIAGGMDYPIEPNNPSIYVSGLVDGGSAALDGRLRIGDRLLMVNGHVVTNVSHDRVIEIIVSQQSALNLIIARIEPRVYSIEIPRRSNGYGFTIIGGTDDPIEPNNPSIYICHLYDGGSAALDGRLRIGDKLLMLNGHDVTNVSHSQAVKIILSQRDTLELIVARNI